jgi:hypothetical protein
LTGQAALYGWSKKRLEFAAMMNSNEKNLAHIINRMANDNSVNAPADAIAYAKNLYRTRSTAAQPSALRRILAVLQMDLAPNKAAFGERSGSTGTARQMLFNAGENAIELRVLPEASKAQLQGQVLGEGFSGAELTLSGSDIFRRIVIGELSEFEMADVPKGYYTLTIRSSEKEIVIEDVDI